MVALHADRFRNSSSRSLHAGVFEYTRMKSPSSSDHADDGLFVNFV
jgi:hypothetical protein